MSRGLRLLLIMGSASAIVGIIQLLWGWYYAGIVSHQATAVGKIVHIYNGKHTRYEYTFPLGNLVVQIQMVNVKPHYPEARARLERLSSSTTID